MVYSNKFVICVLVKGNPVQELANGQVNIPFGTEYSIRLRNKNNQRAVAFIYIDGENVSDGGFVVPANSHIDISRHACVDKSFKFVSLESSAAVDYGKNGENKDKSKGLIEVRFHFEKQQNMILRSGNPNRSWSFQSDPWNIQSQSGQIFSACSSKNLSLSDGCTVEGSATGQQFDVINIRMEDDYTSLKIFLQGYEEKNKDEDFKNMVAEFLQKNPEAFSKFMEIMKK